MGRDLGNSRRSLPAWPDLSHVSRTAGLAIRIPVSKISLSELVILDVPAWGDLLRLSRPGGLLQLRRGGTRRARPATGWHHPARFQHQQRQHRSLLRPTQHKLTAAGRVE
jgi:hypothetical protein